MKSIADFSCFDPKTGKWTELTPLPEPRSSHDAVVVGDYLYVVGGWNLPGDGADGEWHDTAWKINLKENDAKGWETVPNPPFHRRALAVAHWKNHVVAMGGISSEGGVTGQVDALDLKTGEWKRLATLPGEGISGFGISAFDIDGTLCTSGMRGVLYSLSDDGTEWIARDKLEIPRFFHRLVPAGGNRVVAVAGAVPEHGKEHLKTVEVLELGDPIQAGQTD